MVVCDRKITPASIEFPVILQEEWSQIASFAVIDAGTRVMERALQYPDIVRVKCRTHTGE